MTNVIRLSILIMAASFMGCDDQSAASSDNKVISARQAIYFTVESNHAVYTRERDGWYHISESHSEVSMMMGESGESLRSTNTDLPDRSAGEYEKIILIRQGEKFYLEERLRSSVDLPFELNVESKDEIEFIQGDWFEYEAGQQVSFRLSKAGLKTAGKSFKRQLEESLLPMVRLILLDEIKQLKRVQNWRISDADLGRLVYVDVKMDVMEFPNTVYLVRGNTISYAESRPAKIDIQISMGITAENYPQAPIHPPSAE